MARSLTRLTGALLAGAAFVSVGASTYGHGDPVRDDAGAYLIALNGDMPYGNRGRAEYPNVIKEINAFRPAFTLFDGDTKSGSEKCPDSFYPANKVAYWDVYEQPAVYAVGDNEWTGWRSSAGPASRRRTARARTSCGSSRPRATPRSSASPGAR